MLFLLLVPGLASLIALAFEFVNGFGDTAKAFATVTYTNSMPFSEPRNHHATK